MTRLIILFVVFLSGCAVYGDERRYYSPGHGVLYQQSYPVYRGHYDDRDYRWHRDRYQDRRHSHYAPGYDGRYQWHDQRGRYERHREQTRGYVHPPRNGWSQHSQQSWQHKDGRKHDGYSRDRGRDRGWEQKGKRQSPPSNNNLRGWSISR